MISEKAICELFSAMLPSGRANACFESDAEIISLNGTANGLFTTDEFSAEDLFREDDPYLLGWNIAAGAISDILACGGVPLYYAHALTVHPRWDAAYLRRLASGVRDVLKASGARFIGGDCGRSEVWRCTVSVIGQCEGAPVRRRGARPEDMIYLSGEVGAGNLEAALRLFGGRHSQKSGRIRTQFPLRLRESALVRDFASCCIDTSDGVCAALNAIADLNGCGYVVAELPYLRAGLGFCRRASLPEELLFLGECGEYELLFTVRRERDEAFLVQARKSGCPLRRIGVMTATGRKLLDDERTIDLSSWRRQARDFERPEQYLAALGRWLDRQPAVGEETNLPERL
jgi:thiamine-monophosphate kinase